ncbi:hypothetical protein QSJ19_03025 [Gordonia sp. ABSL11-1]|uniref:glycine-rich domain-containing protein n=1 Tax=Gordonia sp. ABSL11-1 TaxID=3053924 RepID=UPI0025728B81|nr:hypothetical protein [Gordonia sp. ABSL11-1]MDL9944572.1 hypothetical protein [Gordonia sp. ABSL11-1]
MQITLKSSSGSERTVTPSANRISDLSDVREYIAALNFEEIKSIITQPGLPSEAPIEDIHADFCELHYKRWLFLRRKHEGELLPPTKDIDVFWHSHILDTYRYHEDCDHIFGYYFHHFPYFGVRGPDDERALKDAFRKMVVLYKEEFGVDLPAFLTR